MKTPMYYIFIITFILSLFISCTDKKNRQNNSISKPIVLDYKSQIDEYNEGQHRGSKWLLVKKIISPKEITIIYKYEYYTRIDSLVISKDTIKMNNENLFLLDKKMILYRNQEIEIKKYQYTKDKLSNYFINDSLGIIVEYGATHPRGKIIRRYEQKKYKELCDEIMTDSVFFNLKFNF